MKFASRQVPVSRFTLWYTAVQMRRQHKLAHSRAYMTTPTLERIETDIAQLSLTEQLWLMERLAHRIRQSSLRPLNVQEEDLAAMAADPAIQHEIQQIAAEFALTELNGLDRNR
jgi:hypothetical protein